MQTGANTDTRSRALISFLAESMPMVGEYRLSVITTAFWQIFIAPDLERWVPKLIEWCSEALEYYVGDGGSSPRPEEMSTCAYGGLPGADPEMQRRLDEKLRNRKRIRRRLLNIAHERGREIQERGTIAGNIESLEEMRVAFVTACITGDLSGVGATLIPSKVSSASPYLLFCILRKMDPRFNEYATTLARVLPGFSDPIGDDPWASFSQLPSLREVIYEPGDAVSLGESLPNLSDACREASCKEDGSPSNEARNLLKNLVFLAGMCVEHGHEVISRHTQVPPDPKFLSSLEEKEPALWESWRSLLTTSWAA